MPTTRWRVAPPLLAFLLLAPATLLAQVSSRTDVVTLRNGDRITGEIMRLDRGRLEFKTDDAGTLQIEWDKVVGLTADRSFEVTSSDGLRFFGSLARSASRSLAVAGADEEITVPMAQVTSIAPIGRSFWRKLDGSFDAGFSYTKSSGVAQLNVNSDTRYRKPAFEGRLALSLTATMQDEGGGRDDRGSLDLSYVRYRWARWFVSAAGRFETNESLGLRLRSQVGAAIGPRLVNTNRAVMTLAGGFGFNDERGVDTVPTRNVEALLAYRASYFTYDRPRTNLDLELQYYPSLSNWGRNRLQLDASAKREVWKDFFLSANVFDTYDSRPPNAAFDTNDFGVVLSIGWSY